MKKVATRARKSKERLDAESARRVKALLTKLNLTQTQLLNRLGGEYTKGSVSMWVQGRVPSRDGYHALARIAPYPDCLWFYSRAGFTRTEIAGLARKALPDEAKKLFSAPAELVRVRALSEFNGDEVRRIPFAAEFVQDPLSTECFIVSEDSSSSDLSPGDLVVVDTTDRDSQDLNQFWNQVVLIEFFPEQPTVGRAHWTENPGRGLYIGRLKYKRVHHDLGADEGKMRTFPFWTVTLGPCNDQQTSATTQTGEIAPYTMQLRQGGVMRDVRITRGTVSDLVGIQLGSWSPHLDARDLEFGDTDESWAEAEMEAERRVPREAQLIVGVRILGRVLGRYWPAKEKNPR